MRSTSASPLLIDKFKREISYLRVSVTDRCNFRCVYCMAEEMTFLPKSQVLTLEEIHRLVSVFVSLGVTKIRLTGGEPLVRHNVTWLIQQLGKLTGITQLALTTNGALLPKYAQQLHKFGVNKLNISIDTLNPTLFTQLTRWGKVHDVLEGVAAAKEAGFANIRLNAVILKGINDAEVLDLIDYARDNSCDIAFIEEMPLGVVTRDRQGESISSDEIYAQISKRYKLSPISFSSGGPARYYQLVGTKKQIRVGFISPHSHNFCASCNRIRLTAEGRLLLCLGNEHSINLREPLRTGATDAELAQLIIHAMDLKPQSHEFDLSQEPQILRFMNSTGG